jgi:hypothetical protein
MADKKISALPAASTPLAGTEVLPIVQGGITEQVSVANLTAGRAVNALSATTTAGLRNTSAGSDTASTPDGLFLTDGANKNAIVQLGASGGVSTFIFESGGAGWRRVSGLLTNGNSVVDVGNLVIGTAGKGIDFSANGGDVLSQYDEGTYTPVFTASTSNPTVTYGLQRGKYVRIGNTVTVSVFISWSAFSGGSGDLQISLPFAGESSVGAGAAGAIADLTGFTFAAGRTFCSVRPNSNVLYATFPQSGSLVSTSNTTVAQTASSGLIVFSCTYLI